MLVSLALLATLCQCLREALAMLLKTLRPAAAPILLRFCVTLIASASFDNLKALPRLKRLAALATLMLPTRSFTFV